MKKIKQLFSVIFTVMLLLTGLILLPSHKTEEGMFPLNYLDGNALKNAGLKLSTEEIFNPGKTSLTDALVKVGGCTGSFISDEGLIITNHHCVYGNVARLSSEEHNYLENGFIAKEKSQELPVSMPCKITQSYEDVTDQVLAGINDKTSPEDRAKIIQNNIKTITEKEKELNPELSIEVSEMFVGKSYTLFRYIFLQDVRLVMAPPLTVGQFGGDTDNWEWPRHNGDFSMVRAYVGKNGKPAPYNEDNIPYTPKNTLKINPEGTTEGDFVFIMGYPGRTFRHESGAYLKFQQEVQLPTIQSFFKKYIDWMKDLSENQVGKRLKFASTIQWMENVEKNYRGKMQGLRRTDVVQNRQSQDVALSTDYKKGTNLSKHAAGVINQINNIWNERTKIGKTYFYSTTFTRQAHIIQLIDLIEGYNRKKEELTAAGKKDEINGLIDDFGIQAKRVYRVIDPELEKRTFREVVNNIYKNASESGEFNIAGIPTISESGLKKINKSCLFDTAYIGKLIRTNPSKLLGIKDICRTTIKELEGIRRTVATQWSESELKLKALMPQYINMREEYLESQFIPDANSTLRLTYGYIKSYQPNDGEVHYPFTSLDGVFEKANTLPDYRLPKSVADKLRKKDVPAIFKDPKTGKVVVGILYNLDTTGGNSGSPVLNNQGELIGINFDRSFTATINDYAWNEKYSRSIGVDIRYVLYVLKYVSEGESILEELDIEI